MKKLFGLLIIALVLSSNAQGVCWDDEGKGLYDYGPNFELLVAARSTSYDAHERIGNLIKTGAEVNICDDAGNTPLHRAALVGNLLNVKILLKLGANIHAKNNSGMTPLHCAAGWRRYVTRNYHRESTNNDKEIILTLLIYGADETINNTDSPYYFGGTALHLACEVGLPQEVKLLIKYGADINARNNQGQTPLDVAENPEIKKIIEKARAK